MIREGVRFVTEQNRLVWDLRNPRCGLTFVCCMGRETALVGLHGRLWRLTGINIRLLRVEFLYLYFIWRDQNSFFEFYNTQGMGIKNYLSCHVCHKRPFCKRAPMGWARTVNVHHLLLRLQRWTRRILWYRKVALPTLMSQHPRLGRDSLLARLDFEVLARLILPCTRE